MRLMVYRLVGDPALSELTPEDFIQTDESIKSLTSEEDLSTKLFWIHDAKHDAEWQKTLHNLFPKAPNFIIELPTAVIITKVKKDDVDIWFAICFGHGHTLINNERIVRRWGLKVALNMICAEVGKKESLRRVDSKVIRANSLAVARQVSRPDTLDSFGINTQIDVLRSITGQPVNNEWGPSVYGQDGISIQIDGKLSDIQIRLKELVELHNKRDYVERFGWVDRVYPVRDISLRTALFDELIQNLRSKNIDSLNLTAPEITDWGNSIFKIKGTGGSISNDPFLIDYLDDLENQNKLDSISIDKLKQHRLINDTTGDSWPLLHCIEGEIIQNGNTYYFSDGEFFEVDSNFVNEVNNYLTGKIHPSKRKFQDNNAKLREEDYIRTIASNAPDLLIMDQKTIDGYPSPTSKVELCDLLSDSNEFIHIKRGIRSATLSHLMMQFQNSTELFLKSPMFRRLAVEKVKDIESSANLPMSLKWSGNLSKSLPNDLDAHIILAITGNWNGKDFIERIPFFSRLSLRLAVQNFEGFNITFESIKIDEV